MNLKAFPDECGEGTESLEAEGFVEADGVHVGTCHGEADAGATDFRQRDQGEAQQLGTQLRSSHSRQNAELGNVAGLLRDQAGKAHAADTSGVVVDGHHGGLRAELAAARILDDVHQKVARAGDGSILVVNVAIDMAAVGAGNDMGGILFELFGPWLERHFHLGLPGWKAWHQSGVQHHEVTVVAPEIMLEGHLHGGRSIQHEQLAFDAMDAGRQHQTLHGGAEQHHLGSVVAVLPADVEVADQTFTAFADVVGVAQNGAAAP